MEENCTQFYAEFTTFLQYSTNFMDIFHQGQGTVATGSLQKGLLTKLESV